MMKTGRSMRSTKSLSYVTDAPGDGEDAQLAPDELAFEELLPNTCMKFNCPYTVIVKKEYRQDAHLKLLKVSDKRIIKKVSAHVPMIERSSVRELKYNADDKSIDYDKKAIVVTSIYDSMNRLITLTIGKAKKIPRVLIQSIGLLAPRFDMLNKITLTRCGIDGQIVYELYNILPKTKITEICLDQSPTKEGNYALLLEVPSRLTNLSLCGCHINDAVARQIAKRLHHPLPAAQSLQLLNLSSNDIGDEGARHLADALRTNRRLRYLNLSNNNITDTGASYLLNAFKEFPLTTDELLDKRNRFLDYIRTRMELSLKFMYDFGVKDFDEISVRSSNPPPKKSHRKSSASVKQSKTMRHKSTSVPRLPMASNQFLRERADSLAGQTLGPFVDPFTTIHVTMKNEWPYCHGNFTLSYLNLAYNNLSLMTIKKIRTVVSYQSGIMHPHESGLIKIVIDGNKLPMKSKELEEIAQLLQKNMSRYTGVGSLKSPGSDRRKSRATRASSLRGKSQDAPLIM